MFNYAHLILLHITRGLPQAPRRGWILPQRGLIPRGIPGQAGDSKQQPSRILPHLALCRVGKAGHKEKERAAG